MSTEQYKDFRHEELGQELKKYMDEYENKPRKYIFDVTKIVERKIENGMVREVVTDTYYNLGE